MRSLPRSGVTYLVTQESLSEGRTTLEIAAAAIRGGVDVIQLREKDRCARDRYQLGLRLREQTADAGVTFIVNDRVDLARAVDADGVHLGDEDLPIAVAREQLGDTALVGRSVSTRKEATQAEKAGADYLGVGSVFHTGSKDTDPDKTAIGLDRISDVRASTSLPIIGIGGIDPSNAADVVSAGANGVAVISAITAADDPERATEQLSDAIEEG